MFSPQTLPYFHHVTQNKDRQVLLMLISFPFLIRRLFAGSVPRVTLISLGGFIFLGAYEKARRTLL